MNRIYIVQTHDSGNPFCIDDVNVFVTLKKAASVFNYTVKVSAEIYGEKAERISPKFVRENEGAPVRRDWECTDGGSTLTVSLFSVQVL